MLDCCVFCTVEGDGEVERKGERRERGAGLLCVRGREMERWREWEKSEGEEEEEENKRERAAALERKKNPPRESPSGFFLYSHVPGGLHACLLQVC